MSEGITPHHSKCGKWKMKTEQIPLISKQLETKYNREIKPETNTNEIIFPKSIKKSDKVKMLYQELNRLYGMDTESETGDDSQGFYLYTGICEYCGHKLSYKDGNNWFSGMIHYDTCCICHKRLIELKLTEESFNKNIIFIQKHLNSVWVNEIVKHTAGFLNFIVNNVEGGDERLYHVWEFLEYIIKKIKKNPEIIKKFELNNHIDDETAELLKKELLMDFKYEKEIEEKIKNITYNKLKEIEGIKEEV